MVGTSGLTVHETLQDISINGQPQLCNSGIEKTINQVQHMSNCRHVESCTLKGWLSTTTCQLSPGQNFVGEIECM